MNAHWKAPAAAVVSAVLYAAAFPPLGLWPLAWVALAPFLVALRIVGAWGAVLIAWLWTLVAAYAVGDWFPVAVARYYQQHFAVGVGFFVGVSTLMAGIHYCAFAFAYRVLARRASVIGLPLVTAAAWVSAEFTRTEFLSGNPWALAGYSQVDVLPLVQIADLVGVFGVTFLLLAVNAAVAQVWMNRGESSIRRSVAALGIATALVAMASTYGVVRMRQFAPGDREATTVAVVQGDLDVGSQWQPEFYGRNLGQYLQLTRDLVGAHHPSLVVWPESAMTFFLDEEPQLRAAIAAVTGPSNVQLLTGGPRTARSDAGSAYYNAAFVLSPDGEITAVYDKEELLPFAEYFPLGEFELLRRNFARVRTFVRGERTSPVSTRAGMAGLIICNEAFFGPVATRRVREGATYLVNLANDSWLGDRKFSAMALDMVRLRAVEQRRVLVRASTSGPSAIVDPRGVAVVVTEPASRAGIAGTVWQRTEMSVYARLGDAFAYACVCVVVAGIALSRSRPSR